MGHKRIDSTARYTKPSERDMELVVARLEHRRSEIFAKLAKVGRYPDLIPDNHDLGAEHIL